jgi:AraC-like DNA-binding protein
MGAVLLRLSQSLYEEAELFKEEEGARALDTYFRILSACFVRGRPCEPEHMQLRPRIQRYIDGHLSDPELRPAEIASAAEISVRHLHRLFAGSGGTLGDCIRKLRLQQCRNDLENPRLRSKTITEIAFSWGFSDSAHFSRSFRKQFGICPRKFREEAGVKSWRENDRGACEFLRIGIADPGLSKPN